MKILSDHEKLALWDMTCIEFGWARMGEMDQWLSSQGIHFTGGGSCVHSNVFENRIFDIKEVQPLINQLNGEELATAILQALCGILVFASTEIEKTFWLKAKEKMWKVFHLQVPFQVVPLYVREQVFTKDEMPE